MDKRLLVHQLRPEANQYLEDLVEQGKLTEDEVEDCEIVLYIQSTFKRSKKWPTKYEESSIGVTSAYLVIPALSKQIELDRNNEL